MMRDLVIELSQGEMSVKVGTYGSGEIWCGWVGKKISDTMCPSHTGHQTEPKTATDVNSKT